VNTWTSTLGTGGASTACMMFFATRSMAQALVMAAFRSLCTLFLLLALIGGSSL